MIKTCKNWAALFDFDGVVVDTETQYSYLWTQIGKEFFGDENFAAKVKGQTLVQIFNRYFADKKDCQKEIEDRQNRFESKMTFDYIPGVVEFIANLPLLFLAPEKIIG